MFKRYENRDQFLTLANTGSLSFNPDNSNQCFTNILGRPIKIGIDQHSTTLGVGLLDIYYTPAAPKPVGNIFGHHDGDDKISWVSRKEVGLRHWKKSQNENIFTFTNNINKQFETLNFKVKFTLKMNMVLNGVSGDFFIMNNNYEDGKVVTIDKVYGKALGFEDIEYGKGETMAKHPFSEELFLAIDMSVPMELIAFTEDPHVILTVKEPTSKTAHGLVASMNESISTYHREFSYNGVTFDYKNTGGFLGRVQLSPFKAPSIL